MHYHSKTMVTVFFNCTGEYFLKILPRSRFMDSEYFGEEIVGGMDIVHYPEGKSPHERTIIFHFDNAPIHNRRTVM
jgi:hypothetical protein